MVRPRNAAGFFKARSYSRPTLHPYAPRRCTVLAGIITLAQRIPMTLEPMRPRIGMRVRRRLAYAEKIRKLPAHGQQEPAQRWRGRPLRSIADTVPPAL